jgi:hypothetical protein
LIILSFSFFFSVTFLISFVDAFGLHIRYSAVNVLVLLCVSCLTLTGTHLPLRSVPLSGR